MYKGLIQEQIERINKARDQQEGYSYFDSVESLCMLLPEGIELKALQYLKEHTVTTKNEIDLWYGNIRELMEIEGLHIKDRRIEQLEHECNMLYNENMHMIAMLSHQYRGLKHEFSRTRYCNKLKHYNTYGIKTNGSSL